MKRFLAVIPCLLLSVFAGLEADEFTLGLDTNYPAVRAKKPILVYFGNDRIAPLPSAEMSKVNSYLKNCLSGSQLTLYREDQALLTEDDLLFYEGLSDDEKVFLTKVGNFSSVDSSEYATANETRAIINNIARMNPKYNMGFVVFRNFKQGRPLDSDPENVFSFLHSPSNNRSPLESSIKVSDLPVEAQAFPYADQPLSHPGVVARLMEEVKILYPPAAHRYLIVFKSQGGAGLAVSPRYDVKAHKDLNFQDLVKKLITEKQTLLRGESELPDLRGTNSRLSAEISQLSMKEGRAGISAANLLDILAKDSSDIPLVFFDSNEVEITTEYKDPMRYPNIGSVFYTEMDLPYETLDYFDLFSFLGVSETDFEDRFKNYIRQQLPFVETTP